MTYVDGFIVPVLKARLTEYAEIARKSGALWIEHGALGFVETVADDVPYGTLTSFPRAVQLTEDEVVVLSWIIYESREHRDEVMAKVTADPRLAEFMEGVPVDGKRMIFGGFKELVNL